MGQRGYGHDAIHDKSTGVQKMMFVRKMLLNDYYEILKIKKEKDVNKYHLCTRGNNE